MKKILIVILLIIGVFVFYPQLSTQAPDQNQEKIQSVKVVVDDGENKQKLDLEVGKDATAFSALEDIASKKAIELVAEQYDFGVYVSSIGGKKNSDEKAWIYYINGESGSVAADRASLAEGDLLEWKYVEPIY